jgi:uncharacterized protein YjiK
MGRPLLLLSLVLVDLGAGCTGDGAPAGDRGARPEADDEAVMEALPYRLGAPDTTFTLPPALREVSGLTALGPDRLGAVQDEDGVLYVLDPRAGTIAGRHRFHDGGDYEGVEAVGDTVWVLQSNGTLHELDGATGASPARGAYETSLRSRCDAEGLGYDPAHRLLLIACKEEPGLELAGVRAIYAFGLREKRLFERPVFLLDRRPLDADGTAFKPSALAVHPRTGALYVISSARKALAVLDREGHLVAAVALPGRLYRQPEGLAFLPDGTLFIANESGNGAATLLRFSEVRL